MWARKGRVTLNSSLLSSFLSAQGEMIKSEIRPEVKGELRAGNYPYLFFLEHNQHRERPAQNLYVVTRCMQSLAHSTQRVSKKSYHIRLVFKKWLPFNGKSPSPWSKSDLKNPALDLSHTKHNPICSTSCAVSFVEN